MYDFNIALAGVRVRVRARFPETIRRFRGYALPEAPLECLPPGGKVSPKATDEGGPQSASALTEVPRETSPDKGSGTAACGGGGVRSDASVSSSPSSGVQCAPSTPLLPYVAELGEWEWRETTAAGMPENDYTEYTVLTAFVSDALLDADRVIFHGVALRWRDQAYLITAPSGVGKSTQFKHLNALRPGEFSVICGDRPVVSFQDSEIMVHPSPWNGKESWCGAAPAPLGGIILLRRGEENRLEAAAPKEIALEIFAQFIQSCREADKVRKVAELETKMLESVPLWRLTTHMVPDSTELLLESVFTE